MEGRKARSSLAAVLRVARRGHNPLSSNQQRQRQREHRSQRLVVAVRAAPLNNNKQNGLIQNENAQARKQARATRNAIYHNLQRQQHNTRHDHDHGHRSTPPCNHTYNTRHTQHAHIAHTQHTHDQQLYMSDRSHHMCNGWYHEKKNGIPDYVHALATVRTARRIMRV